MGSDVQRFFEKNLLTSRDVAGLAGLGTNSSVPRSNGPLVSLMKARSAVFHLSRL